MSYEITFTVALWMMSFSICMMGYAIVRLARRVADMHDTLARMMIEMQPPEIHVIMQHGDGSETELQPMPPSRERPN